LRARALFSGELVADFKALLATRADNLNRHVSLGAVSNGKDATCGRKQMAAKTSSIWQFASGRQAPLLEAAIVPAASQVS
jgi:hypothetical protein